jgi:hypothetical protein
MRDSHPAEKLGRTCVRGYDAPRAGQTATRDVHDPICVPLQPVVFLTWLRMFFVCPKRLPLVQLQRRIARA